MAKRMKRFFTSFIKRFDQFNDLLSLITGMIMGLTALIIIYEVIMRYVARRPTTWVNDVSEILLVYCTFLIAPWILRQGGHIKVDILVVGMRKKGQMIMGIIQDLLSLFFCGIFTWITWGTFWDSLLSQERTSGGLFSVPLWPVYMVIPIGGFLLSIQLIRQIVENYIFFARNRSDESNALRSD